MATDAFKPALERTIKTWQKYTVALCALTFAFVIDAVGGFEFFKKQTEINLAGFKVVREAFSLSYGIFFCLFTGLVFLESSVLEKRSTDGARSAEEIRPLLDGWIISPFSERKLLRALFWYLFGCGFITLAGLTLIHLALWWPPDRGRMSWTVYRAIGVFDAATLFVSLWFGYRTYRNLRAVRATLPKD